MERESVFLSGFSHANPIPAASRVGPFLASGVLTGKDTISGEMPSTLEQQCANVFIHVGALLQAAGGSTDDILKMTFWLADYRDRASLNSQWEAMFPLPESRPARQAIAAKLDGGTLIQCDLLAVLSK